MPDLINIASTLERSLRLTQAPVAVAFVDDIPAGVRMWAGAVPAGCRFWQEAIDGVFATAAPDHDLCSVGVYTHNLEMTPGAQSELGVALKVFGDLGYVRPEDIAMIPVLKRRPHYVVYGPLSQIPVAPNVVLLFVKANQALILSEAAQQTEGGSPPAMGRPACAAIPQAVNTGRTTLSLGCCGARAYLDVLTDDVAVFALPGSTLEALTARVEALAKANEILTTFHTVRRHDVGAGKRPAIAESLAAIS